MKDSKAQRTAEKESKNKSGEAKKKSMSVKEKPKKRQARPKTIKYPNRPKKPANAYFVYLEEFRKTFKEMHPDIKRTVDLCKACGEKWKGMSEAEKAPYVAKALEKRAEYKVAMTAYENNLEGDVQEATPEESVKTKPDLNEDEKDDDEQLNTF